GLCIRGLHPDGHSQNTHACDTGQNALHHWPLCEQRAREQATPACAERSRKFDARLHELYALVLVWALQTGSTVPGRGGSRGTDRSRDAAKSSWVRTWTAARWERSSGPRQMKMRSARLNCGSIRHGAGTTRTPWSSRWSTMPSSLLSTVHGPRLATASGI